MTMTDRTPRPIETAEQGLRRLAAQARERGIRVYQYEPTSEWYANSYTSPDRLHRVTRVSCDCPGFVRHGRCQHHADLLHYLGELPPDPPSPPRMRVVPCANLKVSA